MKTLMSLVAAAGILASSAAFAASDTPANAPAAKPAATASHATHKMKVAGVKSEKSKKCSTEATAKKLHGKARKAFRKTCMKAA